MKADRHATIEQLLELKDGEQNDASLHVRSCDVCQQELAALEQISEQLFQVADQTPSADLWQRVLASTEGESSANHGIDQSQQKVPMELLAAQYSTEQPAQHRSLSHAIYTLAASIMVTGFIGLYMFSQNLNSQSQNELLQANIQQLMINSRGMEQALEQVALQSELLTTSQRSQADRLYWQLAYLDQAIHDSNANTQADPQRQEVLWNNRIRALRELNQLYYQRQQTLDDSEI